MASINIHRVKQNNGFGIGQTVSTIYDCVDVHLCLGKHKIWVPNPHRMHLLGFAPIYEELI